MKKLLLPLLLATAGFALADETTVCSANGMQRTITVASGDQGCQVNYTKGDATKTLWYSHHIDYCNARAAEFIEKQKGWGFDCKPQTQADTAPVAADDKPAAE